MRPITVVVTGCGGFFMRSYLESIRQNYDGRPTRIIACDMNADDQEVKSIVDKCYKVPPAYSPRNVLALLKICEIEHADVIVPTLDAELVDILNYEYEFQRLGTKFCLCKDISTYMLCSKSTLMNVLSTLSIHHPTTIQIRDFKEYISCLRRFSGRKHVIKIDGRAGSRGVRVVDRGLNAYNDFANSKMCARPITLQQALEIVSEKPIEKPMIVQEYLPGNEYSLNMLCKDGKVLAVSGKEILAVENSTVHEAISHIDTKAMADAVVLADYLKLNGNIGFDFKRNTDGIACMIEMNLRTTATAGLDTAAGVNLVYAGIKLALGERIDTTMLRFVEGVKMYTKTVEIYR